MYGEIGMRNLALIVSPHSKAIGETYVLPRLAQQSLTGGSSYAFALFNVAGEWDHLGGRPDVLVIENPARGIMRLAPPMERLSPWWNYRIWLLFASMSIFVGLYIVLRRRSDITDVVARMATSAVAVLAKFSRFNVKFYASMAGVPLKSPLRSLTWPFLYSSFDRVVAPCASMIPSVAKLVRRSNDDFTVIPNAVLTSTMITEGSASRFPRQIELTELSICAVGRLTRQKGTDLLIRALPRLSFPCSLVLIGDGEDEGSLMRLATDLGVADRVEFAGRKSDPWKFAMKRGCNLFVMPSRWEGPGHTIIEALCWRFPSVVSDCPFGPEDSVSNGRYGSIFSSNDVGDLTDNLEAAFKNYDELRERAEEGSLQSDKYLPSSVWALWSALLKPNPNLAQ